MTQSLETQVHASCVELEGTAVLLRGPSGSGKSDLSLRVIDSGGRLVADDRTNLAVEDGHLYASPPDVIAGKLEVRGIGILSVPFASHARVGLVVDLVAPQDVERLPENRRCDYLGVSIPLIAMAPFEASAVAKLRAVLRQSPSRV